ncbi:MAG: hypothetical protein LBQ92_04155 [Propionibacteriaceae bacterium]|jgi:hypothetical protein|nr:hypothetical protein [Propionibacteriaceae bacterium]
MEHARTSLRTLVIAAVSISLLGLAQAGAQADVPETGDDKVPVSQLKVGYQKTLAYNGYQQVPASMTVQYQGKNLSPDDYHITIGANKKVGKATFTIHGLGQFTGSKTFTFTIKKMSKAQRLKLAKKEAKRLAGLIPANVTEKRDKIIVIHAIAGQATGQANQSSKAYKKNFGNEAYADFALGTAACSGQVRALILLAKEVGLQAKHVNANKWKHQWARINYGTKANPKWMDVDPQLPLNLGSYQSALFGPLLDRDEILTYFPLRWGSVTNAKKLTPSR